MGLASVSHGHLGELTWTSWPTEYQIVKCQHSNCFAPLNWAYASSLRLTPTEDTYWDKAESKEAPHTGQWRQPSVCLWVRQAEARTQ